MWGGERGVHGDGGRSSAHVAVVVCGHVDSGKSTLCGRLLFELGAISERQMALLWDESKRQGDRNTRFALHMLPSGREARACGSTVACSVKELTTPKRHLTIIDAPGHRNFIKNMLRGASQADVGVLVVPADATFAAAVCNGGHRTGAVQGQTRHHARLLSLLGIRQLVVCVNKMDSKEAGFRKARFDEVVGETRSVLLKAGWKRELVANVPFLPTSGRLGDNIANTAANMEWWHGVGVTSARGDRVHVATLLQALDDFVCLPDRSTDKPLRLPVAGVHIVRGIGKVVVGRIEQGRLVPNSDVVFFPSHTPDRPCTGTVMSIQMHHNTLACAGPGDNVGVCVVFLANLPKVGDVMVLKNDTTLVPVKSFTAQVQTLEVPFQLGCGYTPVGFARCARAPCRLVDIEFKRGRNGGIVQRPASLESNEVAQCVFEPVVPFAVDTFKACEGLGRVGFLHERSLVMLGKVVKVEAGQHVSRGNASRRLNKPAADAGSRSPIK